MRAPFALSRDMMALSMGGVAIAMALCACGGRGRGSGVSDETVAFTNDAVAVVDGHTIGAAQVAQQARAAGVSTKEALDQLIDTELLFAEAQRRGLGSSPEVRDGVAAELARRYIDDVFEKQVTPALVSRDEIEQAYRRNAEQLDRPEIRVVNHVLVPFGKQKPDGARLALLEQRAAEVLRRARLCRSPEEFLALGKELSDDQVTLIAEEVATGASGYTVRQFATPVFAMTHPGEIIGPIETPFGLHVVWLKRIEPPHHVPIETVSDQLRAGVFPDVQRREFAKIVDGLTEKHRIELHPDRLSDEGAGESGGSKR